MDNGKHIPNSHYSQFPNRFTIMCSQANIMIAYLRKRHKNTHLGRAIDILEEGFFKLYHFLGPVAALLGHLIVNSMQSAAKCVKYLEGELYIQGFVTSFLTWTYLYSWSFGNPHLARPIANKPIYEIALMLTSGQYGSSIFTTKSCFETAYCVCGLMIMSGILSDDTGANVIATYFFLVEIASFFFQVRDWAVRSNHPFRTLLDVLYPIVVVVARLIGLWHLTYMILLQEFIPFIHKAELFVITSISTFFASETLCRMGECQPPLPKSVRQRRRIYYLKSGRRTKSTSCLTKMNHRVGPDCFRPSGRTSNFLTSNSRIRC